MMEFQLLARVLIACGIPVVKTEPASEIGKGRIIITQALSLRVDSPKGFDVIEGEDLSSSHRELWMAIEALQGNIVEFAPAVTPVRMEGGRYQPDFQQMDNAEIAAWRLHQIGNDWMSDDPSISLEEFQFDTQEYWEEMLIPF
ncbi:hypothetical protein D3C77_528650 [compost metagenome]